MRAMIAAGVPLKKCPSVVKTVISGEIVGLLASVPQAVPGAACKEPGRPGSGDKNKKRRRGDKPQPARQNERLEQKRERRRTVHIPWPGRTLRRARTHV
jgi:hypothetical protein